MKTCRKILALLIALSTVMSYVTGVSAEESLKSWNILSDWQAAGKNTSDSWKDTYGNNGVWSVHAFTGEVYKQASEVENKSYLNDTLGFYYWGNYNNKVDDQGSDGMVRFPKSGTVIYSRIWNGNYHAYTWTAPESMVADVTVDAKRRWNTGNNYFDLYQDDVKVQNLFTVSTVDENRTKTVRIAVKKGDRITLAVRGINGSGVKRAEYELNEFEIKEVNAASSELQSWDYRKDAYASEDVCKSGVFGDTYGTHNTWGIYFGKTVDGAYKKEPGKYIANDDNYVVVDSDDTTATISSGTRIYFKNTETIVLKDTSYAEVADGTDLYFVFRAPKDMFARLDVSVHNRWGRAGQHVTVYNAEVETVRTGEIGPAGYDDDKKVNGDILNFSEYVFLKTGETVEIKIDNSGIQNKTAVNPYITVTEIEKTYNPVTDYKASCYPKQNTWNTFDKSSNWTLDYTLANGEVAVPTTTDGKTFILNGTEGENKDALMPGETYGVDGADNTWYYLKINDKGAKSNLKWTAPKDGMIEITYKGRTRWENGVADESGWHPMYVDFGIEKNGTKIAGFDSHGKDSDNVMSSVTRKIAVKENDVITFTAESRLLENGMRGTNEAVAYNNIRYIGEASGKLTFNEPTLGAADDTYTATFTGSNQTGEKATAAVILAEYGADGSLINVVTDKIDDYEADFSKSVSLTRSDGGNGFRAFIWDSLSGMKPIETVKAN